VQVKINTTEALKDTGIHKGDVCFVSRTRHVGDKIMFGVKSQRGLIWFYTKEVFVLG
jgi:hypothetical protein